MRSRSPYWLFRPATVAASLLVAALSVSLLAVVTKLLVESLTSLTYTIHWSETVPFLILAAAFWVNGALNARRRSTTPG